MTGVDLQASCTHMGKVLVRWNSASSELPNLYSREDWSRKHQERSNHTLHLLPVSLCIRSSNDTLTELNTKDFLNKKACVNGGWTCSVWCTISRSCFTVRVMENASVCTEITLSISSPICMVFPSWLAWNFRGSVSMTDFGYYQPRVLIRTKIFPGQ